MSTESNTYAQLFNRYQQLAYQVRDLSAIVQNYNLQPTDDELLNFEQQSIRLVNKLQKVTRDTLHYYRTQQ
jgi:hypothetical protein